VNDLNTTVKPCHRGGHRGGGIPLRNDDIGFDLSDDLVKSGQSAGDNFIELLPRLHQAKVIRRGNTEHRIYLLEHFLVLASRNCDGLKSVICFQSFNYWSYLDRFWAGAINGHDFWLAHFSPHETAWKPKIVDWTTPAVGCQGFPNFLIKLAGNAFTLQ